MRKKCILGLLTLAAVCSVDISGQTIALKTNALYDATTTFNGGVELALADHWTVDLSGNYNPWTFSDNRKWKHWLVQPELRYWFCQKMGGHFVGLHLQGGQYNVGNIATDLNLLGTDFSQLRRYRFQGWLAGAGIGYGYAWMLGKHWNVEAEVGAGFNYSRYDKFQCVTCGSRLERNRPHR